MAETSLQQARAAYRDSVRADHELKRITERVHSLEAAEKKALARVRRLREQLAVEEAEAETWAGKGFAQALLAIVGRLDERRDAENAEAEKTALELASAGQRWDEIAQQLTAVRARRDEMRTPSTRVDECLAAVRSALESSDPAAVERLAALEQQSAEVDRLLTELAESAAAARRALASIAESTQSFDSAGSWGVWDMVGGGMIASMAKRGYVRDGLSSLDRVQSDLHHLEQELEDVRDVLSASVPDGLHFDSAAWTWDVWFDNIFSDLNMQSRIREMEGNLAYLADRVRRIADKIDDKIASTRTESARLSAELLSVLLG